MPAHFVRLALAAVVFVAAPALAEVPCLEDAARVCPGIPVGDARLLPCLRQHQFELSSSCQRNLQDVDRRAAEFGNDCRNDIFRFCPTVAVGGGRLLQCLGAYVGRRELGSNCEEAVVTALEKLQEFVDACTNDAANLCGGVEPGGGKLFLCLRLQSDKLSTRCRNAVNPR